MGRLHEMRPCHPARALNRFGQHAYRQTRGIAHQQTLPGDEFFDLREKSLFCSQSLGYRFNDQLGTGQSFG